jgi:two-component system NtrC family sensor kinase
MSIRTRLILSFLLVIVVLGAISALFEYNSIRCNVINRAQNQVQNDLKAARVVYNGEITQMQRAFDLISTMDNPARLKSQLGLDYLFVVERAEKDSVRSDIVRRAFAGNGNGGTRTIDSAELAAMGSEVFSRARIELKQTPRAHPTNQTELTSALAMECAVPFFDAGGMVTRVLYGGKIVNGYFGLVDKIHDIVYESKLYHSKPVGTVTIFKDDVRIATNVLNDSGQRAIGTRVSAGVYDNVVTKGKPWLDRAFVVTDWYLTAYEPIRDINGAIVGIFYVGILEQPFVDLIRSTLTRYLAIIGIAALFAGIVAFLLANSIAKPLTRFATATENLAAGDLTHRIETTGSIRELSSLALSFNDMACKLHERALSLRDKNEQLAVLNARYLDLVGIVSHELKGILGSTVLNTCTVRDGYLGEVSPQQKKALDSVVRNLEYFDQTVRNFLNLSRVEKNELSLSRTQVSLREDIVDVSVDAYARQAHEREIVIENLVPPSVCVNVDASLMLMVTNNLVGNAIKYGGAQGKITISYSENDSGAVVEVFNTGRPLTADQIGLLFRRFSRLDASVDGKKVRGTGLGLFLSKETVERHGGTLRCEPRENGNAFVFTIPKCATETFTTASDVKEYNYA